MDRAIKAKELVLHRAFARVRIEDIGDGLQRWVVTTTEAVEPLARDKIIAL